MKSVNRFNSVQRSIKGRQSGTTTRESSPEVMCRGFGLKEAPASKKESNAWEARPQLGRSLHNNPYELQTEEGKILQHTWNAEHLKRFY